MLYLLIFAIALYFACGDRKTSAFYSQGSTIPKRELQSGILEREAEMGFVNIENNPSLTKDEHRLIK